MGEAEVVQRTEVPATVESLQADLRALGLGAGMLVLVHSSLSAMGWVCGGSVAVIAALREVLGSTGTLVMPAPLDRPGRTERMGKPARPRVVVAGNTRAHAGLRSSAYTHSLHGHYRGDISQATRRPPQRSSPGLVLCVWPPGAAHRQQSFNALWSGRAFAPGENLRPARFCPSSRGGPRK